MKLRIYNHQTILPLSEESIDRLESLANKGLSIILKEGLEKSVLTDLNFVEVGIVNDETISQVHVDFMGIEGATDVITFQHGELIVSAETTMLQCLEYESVPNKELLLYIIHGLLHLAGYDDLNQEDKVIMSEKQEQLLNQLWT